MIDKLRTPLLDFDKKRLSELYDFLLHNGIKDRVEIENYFGMQRSSVRRFLWLGVQYRIVKIYKKCTKTTPAKYIVGDIHPQEFKNILKMAGVTLEEKEPEYSCNFPSKVVEHTPTNIRVVKARHPSRMPQVSKKTYVSGSTLSGL